MISTKISDKILFIGTDLNGKGGIATVINSCAGCVESFHFVCSHRFGGKLSQLWLAFMAALRTLWICAFGHIEIVHIHTASYRAFFRESIYLLIAKAFHKKVILQLHGGEFEIFYGNHSRYCNYICHKADCLVGVSEYFGDMFRRLKLNDNIIVIFNAVDKASQLRTAQNNNTTRILFMGAIDNNKGIFDVLQCFSQHKDRIANTMSLDICGIGDDQRLCNFIKKHQLENFVIYRGWVDKKRKAELLASADIYIQPSYFESFGIAIVEAMSYGIPVVASATGGIPEIVRDAINGYLITPGDMVTFLEKLEQLAQNPLLREEMSSACLATAALFTPENTERDLTQLYKSLLQK